MSSHAAERVICAPELIPTDVSDNVEAIIDLITTVSATLQQPRDINPKVERFRRSSALEGDELISIVGSRGSGKTTLLAAACARLLAEDRALVLPIIRPEHFRATDSLTTVIVAGLSDLFSGTTGGQVGDEPNKRSDVQLALHRTLRAAALATVALGDSLASRSESLSQYALDVMGVIQSRDELIPSLRELVKTIRNDMGGANFAPIVLPIDDIDLIPGRAAEVLSELRQLSSVGGLIPIITFNRADLQRNVEADLSRASGGSANRSAISNLAQQQIEKTVRPALTVEPTVIASHLRTHFKPVGEAKSLNDLLAEVTHRLDAGGSSSRGLMDWINSAAETRSRSNIHGAAWLPETPRRLETLWSVLRQLANALNDQSPTAGTWLKRLTETIGGPSPQYDLVNLDVSETRYESDRVLFEATARWPRVELYTDPNVRRRPRITAPAVRIDFRMFLEPLLEYGDQEDNEPAMRRRIDPMPTSALLMLDSIFQLEAFEGSRPTAPGSLQPFDYWGLQVVRLLGEPTDDRFFAMPITRGAVHFERSRTAWNAIARGLSLPGGTQPPSIVAAYIHAVSNVWLDGDLASARAGDLHDEFAAVTERYIAISDSLTSAGDFYRNYSPDRAFCRWYEECLPFALHELLLPEESTEDLVGRWFAAATRNSQGEMSDAAQSELRESFRGRIDRGVSDSNRATAAGSWFFGYTPVLQLIDAELSDAVSHHRERYQTLKRKAKLGRSLASGVVTHAEPGLSRWSSAAPNAAGDFEFELLLSTVDRLRET